MSALILALMSVVAPQALAAPGGAGVPTLVLPLRMQPGTVSDDALTHINRLYWHKAAGLKNTAAAPPTAIPPAVATMVNTGLPQCHRDDCMGHLAAQAGFKRVIWGWVARTPTDGFHLEARLINGKGVLVERAQHGCYSCDEAQFMGDVVDWDLTVLDREAVREGTLYVSSRPKGAQVRINGEDAGVTPLRGLRLEVGEYVVEVWKKGRKASRREVVIKPGRESRLGVKLKKSR